MLLVFHQVCTFTAGFEIMWFQSIHDAVDEIRARIEDFNPDVVGEHDFRIQTKWEVEAADDSGRRLLLVLEPVPLVAPWPGCVSRQEQLQEVVVEKEGSL